MKRAPRTGVGGRAALLLIVAVIDGAVAPGCAPAPLRGRSVTDPAETPDGIVAMGRAGEIVYALTRSRRLRRWDIRTRELRTLDRDGVIAIARDGSVALSAAETVIDAWDPASGNRIATHRFPYGIAAVRGVSPAAAYVLAKLAPVEWPPNAAALPPPTTELVSWELASGNLERLAIGDCVDLTLSVDGAGTLCDLTLRDRPSGVVTAPPPLAPEWAPPEIVEPETVPCRKCGPRFPETGHRTLSTWLSADGRAVYLTYLRTTGESEWRLDRWLLDPTRKTNGRVEHLVASHEPIADRVIAVSRDGRTVLTDPGRHPPVLRHAPGYAGLPLLAPPVTAAAFTEDDRTIVTGHGDGRMRLWDAASGRVSAISAD